MNPPFICRREALKFAALALCARPFAALSQTASSTPPAPIRLALIESMSGPFANTGEAVFRNLLWAVERVNARGGIKLPGGSGALGGARPLQLDRYDSKGQNEEALSALRAAMDDGARIVLQGQLVGHGRGAARCHRQEQRARSFAPRDLPQLRGGRPGADQRALQLLALPFRRACRHARGRADGRGEGDASLKRVYLIGQDYSFGQSVLRESRRQLGVQRPDVEIVGDELHPMGKVKDFAPYASKIIASGAQAVVTGNWGNDLTLLVKAAREAGFNGTFYTFYGNALGAPAAIGDAGIGRVIAVADWLPNVQTAQSEAFYRTFRARFPRPADDYVHMRLQLMIEALAQAVERAGSTDAVPVARALEQADVSLYGQRGRMRATDHQFQQQLVVGVMDRKGRPGVQFDVEGSGYGFRVVKTIAPERAELPTSCKMKRP
jgi:branched-chain amino acid transport system substrate-binding protein